MPLLLAASVACRSGRPHPGWTQRGIASWYGEPFHGRPTASGEIFDMHRISAAHPTLPFGTVVEVRNLENGRRLTVRINDRGPFAKGRILDLSRAAAAELRMIRPGTALVEITVIGLGSGPRPGVPYAVQVGAFRDPARALALARQLAGLGATVTSSPNGDWHRVRIGSFQTRQEAERMRRELAHRGLEAVIVPVS